MNALLRFFTSLFSVILLTLELGAVDTQSTAQTFTVLYNFAGSPDGANSSASLVQDAEGNLYGTTIDGGTGSCSDRAGCGTVFKLDTAGNENVLYSFTGSPDGEAPLAGLTMDTKGNLYGTTIFGSYSNYGTVFELSKSGKETTLYSFSGGAVDGCYPYGGLLRNNEGTLYGTTPECGAYNYGTAFELSKSGNETILHNFAGGSSDGQSPYEGLVTDKNGNVYGLTPRGGASGQGVLFKLSKSGTLTLLYSFAGGTTDGCLPVGTPVMNERGTFYGTTNGCGASNDGVVWKVNKKNIETVLHNFAGGSSDGANPPAGVIMDAKGNLYGDTMAGGGYDNGTVYELTRKGTLILLHSFDVYDGDELMGGVIGDAKGSLYGTTYGGGANSDGTVWQITK